MPRQTPSTKRTVKRVMHEFKHHELKSGQSGKKVKNPKQAIAIALSEAGYRKRSRRARTSRPHANPLQSLQPNPHLGSNQGQNIESGTLDLFEGKRSQAVVRSRHRAGVVAYHAIPADDRPHVVD